MTKVTKAVFPVAGLGTRFLPATKAMPKELLPIVDKPLIQYAAEEAISAGIDTLIFVTGRHKRAIEDHFDSNMELDHILRAGGKHKQADMVKNILPAGIDCIFVRQSEQPGLGHAVFCAERAVGNDTFAVLLADDFLVDDKTSTLTELISAFENSGKTQLSVMKVNENEISKYGAVVPGISPGSVASLIEKPKPEYAPSNLASIGRYVLTPDIFEILRNQPAGANGEIQLSDAINTQAANKSVESIMLSGKLFDCGSVEGFIAASNHVFSEIYQKK